MSISIYHNLKNDRQYSASVGMNKEQFDILYNSFEKIYTPKNKLLVSQKDAHFTDKREALFFILFYFKNYPTLQVLGLLFGISDFSAHTYIGYILPSLKKVLNDNKDAVSRIFETQEDFDKAFKDVKDIFIDGTEIPIERSEDYKTQKESFSGKKNSIP